MLLDDIIGLLSNEKSSIYDALLKTKVLLHHLGKRDLIDWVNRELNGYPDGAELPPYRIVNTRVLANMANPAWQVSAHPIPIGHLKEDQRKRLEVSEMSQSLALLEDLATKKQGSIVRPLAMELNGLLSKGLGSGFRINQAWVEISVPDIRNISAQVRSRLLDFLLELRDGVGEGATTDADVKKAAKSVDTAGLFNNAIFGPNATIIVGSENQQTVQITNTQGDFNALSRALAELGVPAEAIKELKSAIEKEEKEGKKPSFRGRVGQWFGKFLGQAAEKSAPLAADEVVKAIAGYFGSG